MTRTYLPPPWKVEADTRKIKKTLREIETLADRVAELYEELHDAAHRQGSGDGVLAGRSGFRVTDPTGDLAASGLHGFMRSKLREVSIEMRHAMSKARRIQEPLQNAERLLSEGFSGFDPEHRQRLARLREIEDEMGA